MQKSRSGFNIAVKSKGGCNVADKNFDLSDDEIGGIQSFGEEKGSKALVPEVVTDDPHPAMQESSKPSRQAPPQTALAVIGGGQTLQQVKTQYVTAVTVQKPRDIGRVRESVLSEAELAGAAFYYGWNVKGKGGKSRVEGPSIDMAMSLVRNYGNCVLENKVSQDETHFTFESALIDLETGTTINRLFRQRKSQGLGAKMDKDRAEDIVFQIGQSKAGRNVVIRALPNWLIEQAMEAAKAGEMNKIDPKKLPETRQRASAFFQSHGVDIPRIERTLGLPIDKWMQQEIVELRGMMTALKEGRATVDELFPVDGTQPEQTKTGDAPKQENPPPTPTGASNGGQAPKTEQAAGASPEKQAPTGEQAPKEVKTQKAKKAEKPAEPPAAVTPPPAPQTVTAPPVAAPPAAAPAPAAANGQFKLGIIKCPDGGMRKGKLVHTRWCNDNCKQKGTCDVFKAGPQAAV
jgi:hypothetical protein